MMHGPLPVPTEFDRPYWEAGRDGVLQMPQCDSCHKINFPPVKRCPNCGSTAHHWKVLSGRGKIWSWVIFAKQYFPDMPPPYTVLRVELEEGPFLITNLVDSDGRELTKDAPVRVVFQQAGDIFLPQFTFA
jgi:uncharacterized OB-fold protein